MHQEQNFSLKNLNTFGVDVSAKLFMKPTTAEELSETLRFCKANKLPLLLIGGGSNILFTKDYDGAVVMPSIKGIDPVHEDPEFVTLCVGAGVEWDSFVEYAVNKGLGGVENLSLIPGNVGASPIQNIGAYGVEAKDTIERVVCLGVDTGKIVEFSTSECEFGYRSSIFKSKLKGTVAITHVWFRLSKKPAYCTHYGAIASELEVLGGENLRNIRQAVINIRNSKLPDHKVLGNAGSFFKNPIVPTGVYEAIGRSHTDVPHYIISSNSVKIPAGWLIEQCGWKGKRKGRVGVHEKQALVLVNYGGATGSEVLELAQAIIASVSDRFNINLEKEVNVI